MSDIPFTLTPPEVTPPNQRPIAVYADTRQRATCSGRSCGAPIEWAEVVGTGARMPFDPNPELLRTTHELGTMRRVDHLALAANHWRTCPDANRFHPRKP